MQTEVIELAQLVLPKRVFGEFLVERAVLDRFQLFRVLQLKDRLPGIRLGYCAVVLGYVPRDRIEELHVQFIHREDLETMTTEAFDREPDIEVVYSPF